MNPPTQPPTMEEMKSKLKIECDAMCDIFDSLSTVEPERREVILRAIEVLLVPTQQKAKE